MPGERTRFKKGERPVGRSKGTPNKLTTTLRASFEQAFLDLQKTKRTKNADGTLSKAVRLVDWARENPGEFYKLAARMVPHEISGPGGAAIPLGVSGSVAVYHVPDNGRAAPRKGNGGTT